MIVKSIQSVRLDTTSLFQYAIFFFAQNEPIDLQYEHRWTRNNGRISTILIENISGETSCHNESYSIYSAFKRQNEMRYQMLTSDIIGIFDFVCAHSTRSNSIRIRHMKVKWMRMRNSQCVIPHISLTAREISFYFCCLSLHFCPFIHKSTVDFGRG